MKKITEAVKKMNAPAKEPSVIDDEGEITIQLEGKF